MAQSPELTFDKIFVPPIRPRLIALSPTLDLVAVVTAKDHVECYRFDGHRAFTHRNATKATVQSIHWTHYISQGRFPEESFHLCVAWSDHTLDYITSAGETHVNVNMSNLRPAAEGDQSIISHLASSTVFVRPPTRGAMKMNDASRNSQVESHSQHSEHNLDNGHTPCARMGIEFATSLNVLGELPPLGALTLGNVDTKFTDWDNAIFNSQSAVESLLNRGCPSHDECLNMLFTCFNNGHLSSYVNETVPVGRYALAASGDQRATDVIAHASHPHSTCKAFLNQSSGNLSKAETTVTLMSFGAFTTTTTTLPTLVHMAELLVAHAQYIAQAVLNVRHHFVAMQRLPNRLLENINTTLKENASQVTIVQALNRLAITGNCVPELREWLVNEVGAAQHKRWDTAIDAGYKNIQDLMHNCLIPGVDRMSTVLSIFRVENERLQTYIPGQDATYGEIDNSLKQLRLLLHSALDFSGTESAQFKVFSYWLLLQIQGQAAESGSATAAELAARAGSVDQAQLLRYITGALQRSRLHAFFGGPSTSSVLADGSASKLPTTFQLMKTLDDHKCYTDSDPIDLDFLIRARMILGHARSIGLALSKRFGNSVDVLSGLMVESNACADIGDIRMQVPERVWPVLRYENAANAKKANAPERFYLTFALTVSVDDRNCILVQQIEHLEEPSRRDPDINNGWIRSWKTVKLKIGECEVMDVKILDEQHCVVLARSKEKFQIVSVPYRHYFVKRGVAFESTGHFATFPCRTHGGNTILHHQAVSENIIGNRLAPVEVDERAGCFRGITFPLPSGTNNSSGLSIFIPAHIHIDTVAGGGTANLCVVNKEGTQVKIYKI